MPEKAFASIAWNWFVGGKYKPDVHVWQLAQLWEAVQFILTER
ncbi:hypothetical protein [Pontibacter flavimaris]|nr:hypothetical protein [Pontibacter flavimaris]